MLLKQIQAHPFDLDESHINGNLILDKKKRNVHPSFRDMLQRMEKQNPQTVLTVSTCMSQHFESNFSHI